MMLLFFWSSGWRRARIFFGIYTLAMGLTLVYTAEHFVSDILIGLAVRARRVGSPLSWFLAPAGAASRRACRRRAHARAGGPAARAGAPEPEPRAGAQLLRGRSPLILNREQGRLASSARRWSCDKRLLQPKLVLLILRS